jgi:hypothetical protein
LFLISQNTLSSTSRPPSRSCLKWISKGIGAGAETDVAAWDPVNQKPTRAEWLAHDKSLYTFDPLKHHAYAE